MKKVLGKLIRPTNRGVRIFVGLLLVVLLCIQVTQSVATNQNDGRKLSLVDGSTSNAIQKLADHYHLKRRGITEQDFKDSLTNVLTTIKTTFVSYSVMAYLWDQEKNLFLLKAWDGGDAEVNEKARPPKALRIFVQTLTFSSLPE